MGACFICDDTPTVHRTVVTSPTDQIREAGRRAGVERAKRSLAQFIQKAWHVLEPNTPLEWSWHIQCQADHIQWMLEQWMGRKENVCSDLIINVPPGSLKSLTLSVFAPAWMWLPCNAPHWSLMALSGSLDVVMRDARKMRRLITSDWYKESFNIPWQVSPDQNALTDFANTMGGVRHSQTSNSAVTGQRMDAVFNDDPNDVKDTSKLKLKQAQVSWKAAGNRLNDMRVAKRIIIQQRTHELDLSGIMLAQKAELEKTSNEKVTSIQHLCIPMEFTESKCACGSLCCDTTLGKNDPRKLDGEVLHPERNTPEVLKAEKLRLGSLGTAGQLMQRPTPEGGEMFKLEYWRYFDKLPVDRRGYPLWEMCLLSCDEQTKITGTSKTAHVVVASKGALRYIVDVVNRKMDILDSVADIQRLNEKWRHPLTGQPMINKFVIENKANGPAVMSMLSNKLPGMIDCNPDGDKESRARAMLPAVEAGNVLLWRDAPWIDEYKAQFAAFPNGAYDDIIDAVSQALLMMMTSSGLARTRMMCVD